MTPTVPRKLTLGMAAPLRRRDAVETIHYQELDCPEKLMLKSLWVALITVALLACGPSSGAPNTAQSDPNSPKPGGVLTTRLIVDHYDWDPSYTGRSTTNNEALALVYNGLLGTKRGAEVGYA